MARTLIGNFKGPEGPRGQQGPQGEQGPQGPRGVQGESIENNMVGSENLFSMSKEKWRYSGNIAEYDYRNGVIKFSDTIYQFRYEVYLSEGDYTISVDDVINPERSGYENTVTVSLYDSNDNNMRTIGILGGTESEFTNIRNFDITESEEIENDGVFQIQISIANEGRHTGEIKRLQIVRGEVCPTWGLSTEDSVAINSQLMISSPYSTLEGGTQTPLIFSYGLEHDDLLNPDSNKEVILSEGLWSFDWVFTMRNHTDGEECITRVKLNDENFVSTKTDSNQSTTISTKILANEGDTLTITQEVPVGSSFQIDRSVTTYSRFVLYKIRG